jgi:hypothetical protein
VVKYGSAAAASPGPGGVWDGSKYSFLAGPSIFKEEVGAALAVRRDLPNNFRVEWGGVLPHPVSGYASDSVMFTANGSNATENAYVTNFAETHLALLYPVWASGRYTVEGAAGLSLGWVTDHLDKITNPPSPYSPNSQHVLASPWIQVGTRVSINERFSLRLDAAWVRYSNNDTFGANTFDLTFRGIMVRAGVEVRL